MLISIKSEIDSRVILYPMMRALMNYGSILVVSDNKLVKRLIDDEEFSTFRNITILYNDEGAIDDVFESYGIDYGDYDFIIADNMGVTSYDILFFLFGKSHSEYYMEEKVMLEQGEDVNKIIFVEYASNKSSKTEKGKKDASKKSDVIPEGYDPTDKFKRLAGEEKRKEVRTFPAKLPTFNDIELVEGEHIFYTVDDMLIKIFYEAFKNVLGVSELNFRKEVRVKDEGSNIVKPARAGR